GVGERLLVGLMGGEVPEAVLDLLDLFARGRQGDQSDRTGAAGDAPRADPHQAVTSLARSEAIPMLEAPGREGCTIFRSFEAPAETVKEIGRASCRERIYKEKCMPPRS